MATTCTRASKNVDLATYCRSTKQETSHGIDNKVNAKAVQKVNFVDLHEQDLDNAVNAASPTDNNVSYL